MAGSATAATSGTPRPPLDEEGAGTPADDCHDGRAKTLRDVLTTCNKDDRHGKTSHLKPAEIDDLVAFLKSLPYESLPDETPNTVKHYLIAKPKGGG